MGQYDIFVYGGIALVGGWYLLEHPELLQGIFPPAACPAGQHKDEAGACVADTTTEPEPEPEPNGNGNGGGDDTGGDTSTGAYDCAKACRNCWCKSYSEKCSGGCSRCNGGNRVPEKCGLTTSEPSGKFSSVSGGSGGGGGSSKAEICGDLCRRKECSTYQKTCSGNCKNCRSCSELCKLALYGTYKSAGCVLSKCPGGARSFLTTKMIGNFPYDSRDMRLTIA